MNQWDAIKEIQKYSSGLKELIYCFEEYTTEAEEYDEDAVKSVRFFLPLRVSVFFPVWSLAASAGRRYGVDFDIVDVKKLEMEQKGDEWTPYRSNFKAVYTVKCVKESEIRSALTNLRNSKRQLNEDLEKIYRYLPRMKSI